MIVQVMLVAVITKEHGRENLRPEDAEAADHNSEDEHGLGVTEEARRVTRLRPLALLLNVLRPAFLFSFSVAGAVVVIHVPRVSHSFIFGGPSPSSSMYS